MILNYFILGLVYTIAIWIIRKNFIVEYINNPKYENLKGIKVLLMSCSVLIIVCIWPLSLVSNVINYLIERFR